MKKAILAGLILITTLSIAGCGKQTEETDNRFKPAAEKVFGE